MTISHHLDDATLVALAAGTIGEAHGYVALVHLSYCPHCRDALRQAESLGGGLMQMESGTAVSATCRAATLASLDGVKPSQPQQPAMASGEFPPVLDRLLGGQSLDGLNWKSKGPGVAMYDVPLKNGGSTHLTLLRIGPGRTMPEHGHGGEELTLVLRGSYRDHIGRYGVGDVADLDDDVEHQPAVDSDVDCICLVATEAPTRFKGFWARLMQPLVGI